MRIGEAWEVLEDDYEDVVGHIRYTRNNNLRFYVNQDHKDGYSLKELQDIITQMQKITEMDKICRSIGDDD